MASAGRHEQTRACCPRAPVAEYGERDERLDKTASVHVSRILAKLSVPSRCAAAAAQRLGVVRPAGD
jgi:hypothetical protein